MPRLTTETIGEMMFKTRTHGHTVITSGPAAWGGIEVGLLPSDYLPLALSTGTTSVLQHWVMKHLELEPHDFEIETLVKWKYGSTGRDLVDFEILVTIDGFDHRALEEELVIIVKSCPVVQTLAHRIRKVGFLGT